jgi:hypothetical protein
MMALPGESQLLDKRSLLLRLAGRAHGHLLLRLLNQNLLFMTWKVFLVLKQYFYDVYAMN